MKNFLGIKRHALAAVVVMGCVGALAACHNNDDDDVAGQPPVAETPPPPPPAATDAFIAYVTQLIATTSETAEPVSIDGIAATTPETAEPQALPAS